MTTKPVPIFHNQIGDLDTPNSEKENHALKPIRKKDRPGYSSWAQMKQRCGNRNHKHYKDYGGRGITYHDNWEGFEEFIADMGPPPSKDHSLDRIDSDGNYEKKNCRWATKTEQTRNRRTTVRVEFDGKLFTLSELAELYKIPLGTVAARIRSGMSAEEAIRLPVHRGGDRRSQQKQRLSEFDRFPVGLPEAAKARLELRYRSRALHDKVSRPEFFLNETNPMWERCKEGAGCGPDYEVDPERDRESDVLSSLRNEAADCMCELRRLRGQRQSIRAQSRREVPDEAEPECEPEFGPECEEECEDEWDD